MNVRVHQTMSLCQLSAIVTKVQAGQRGIGQYDSSAVAEESRLSHNQHNVKNCTARAR